MISIAAVDHIGIRVADEARARLGNGTSLFIRDPDHNVVELREKG